MTLTEEKQSVVVYNPSAIVNIFNNALNNEATRRIIIVRGTYIPGKGQNYNGYYYDQLRDETSDASITLIVPAIIRADLIAQQTIECRAYLTKKVQANGARIELQLNITELLHQKESQFTPDQIKALDILQRKAKNGYKDVDAFIKTKIIKNEPIRIVILIGKTGIIDSDIKHQLEEAISFYDFRFERINLTSEKEIIDALYYYQDDADLLIVSRGGGDRLEIFNKPDIAEAALQLNCHFITAIGHQQDNTLLQKVADKAFITPTALGQYFNDMYNSTVEELQSSKAKLVEDITKQLEANYNKQIQNLEEHLKAAEELHAKAAQSTEALYKKEMDLLNIQLAATTQQHQQQLKELQKIKDEKRLLVKEQINTIIYWVLIIVALIVGIIIGKNL
jgi:exodeoxyribonuclease VII large subunit